MVPVSAIAVIMVMVVLLLYVMREATMLKTTASALQCELRQFKEGGLDRLIHEQLSVFTQQSVQAVQEREHVIQAHRAQLLEEERKAADAAHRFSTDLGALAAQLSTLRELHTQVGELNNLLKPQQLRGELGEVIIHAIIADKLPPGSYEENLTFPDGKQVEFAIKLNGRFIPIDSKLPLDDFKRMREPTLDERQRQALRAQFHRTIKKKIDEVKAYIRPEDQTFPFALLVIPSEAVYYELIASREFTEPEGLSAYARERNVFLTSPSTFWAYVSALAHGLRGLEIERHAEQILERLQGLAAQIRHFSQDAFRKVGGHLHDAAKNYDEAERSLRDIDMSLTAIERLEPEVTYLQQGERS